MRPIRRFVALEIGQAGMYYPTTRVLTLLELLQNREVLTGGEIADLLDVNIRSARRYIVMLEELGIPVRAIRGQKGGYSLMPGFKLPPMVFTEEESLAIVVGLLAVRHLRLAGQKFEVEGALGKLQRVLPDRVRSRMRAVEEAVVWDPAEQTDGSPNTDAILMLSTSAREQKRVSMQYRGSTGDETERLFDPYGLVCRRGSWYVIGYCHLRECRRVFRLERVVSVTAGDESFEKPAGFDVLKEVLTSLGSVPRHLPLEVVMHTTLEDARRHVSTDVATLDEIRDGCVLLRGYTDNADWMARILARAGCRLEIRRPPELRAALRRHAAQIAQWAGE